MPHTLPFNITQPVTGPLSAICCLLALGLPLSAQVCYQFSDGPSNSTFVATVSIAAVPPSQPVVAPLTYGASFTTFPSAVNSSPLNVVTINIGQTTYSFNSFSAGIAYTADTFTELSFQGNQFPPDSSFTTFSIRLDGPRGAKIFPDGLTATLPPMVMFSSGTVTVDTNNPSKTLTGKVLYIASACSASSTPPPPPAIQASGVVSAGAFGAFTSVSPGSWIEIYGSNLAVNSRPWGAADFTGVTAPTSLDGTFVTIGGKAAFIDYISPGQVNALVPSDTPVGTQPLTVTTAAGISAAYSFTVNALQPGILAPSSFAVNGKQYVVALFPDGTYVLPAGAIAGVTSRPAKPGETIVLYGVGFGPVTPAIPAGQLVQQANALASSLHMSIGGLPALASYAGLAPSFTGLYQFNVTVPAAAPGNAPLAFTIGGTPGTQTLFIAVGN